MHEKLVLDFMEKNDVFGRIHLRFQLQMNVRMLFECGRVRAEWFWCFWTWFACVFQLQQPECLQTNCTFYFWKLPHVFEMSFDVFRVFGEDARGMEMYVNGFGDEFTCREFIFYSCEFTEWRHSVCVVPLPFLKTETAKQGQAQHCKLHELHVTLLFVFPVWKRDPSAVSEFGLVLSGFS